MDATNERQPRLSAWGDVPEQDRLVWMRYMVEHPPVFPGAMWMNWIARAVLAGQTDVISSWSRFAAAMHAAGFGPVDFYLLCQDLSIRQLQGDAAEDRRPDLFRVDPPMPGLMAFDAKTGERVPPEPRLVLIPEKWSTWPLHLRFGRTPRRATEWVLTDGNPRPISVDIRTIGAPSSWTDGRG